MTEAELLKAIKSLIAKGDQAKEKAEQYFKSAGLHLKTLKAEGAHKRHGMTWAVFVTEKCGLGNHALTN